MALSWNEIRTRATAFATAWRDKTAMAREEADAQTFQTEFFHVFGVLRSQVAIFEQRVKLLGEGKGYIDLFWKGHILVEMKSPGKDLEKAFAQAKEYANALDPKDLPKGILVCDFVHFHYYNLANDVARHEFLLEELVDRVELFGDLAGYKDVEYKKQDAVNIAAAEAMGRLHDRLKAIGYEGHQLEVYLVRLLFCLFADDTGIFDEHDLFVRYIVQRTNVDGSDIGLHLGKIFETLNKPVEKRQTSLDAQLTKFPYVNGGLFEERLEAADFDAKMRESLLECCTLDWSKISPAIFGAMFQSVMNATERRNLGAHYTSEENILKLIHPLFLDELWAEFDRVRALRSEIRKTRLNEFHEKLASLRFLDPACGCGNFLVITYRELRILELEIIRELLGGERLLDVDHFVKVNVDQFYGIEIEEFPAHIAEVAMWLMDHQMNLLVRDKFGEYYIRIPLRESATIVSANALTTDWESVAPKEKLSYILGNPPFVGAMLMNQTQRAELRMIFGDELGGTGELDYVSAWYKKALDFIRHTPVECAFVSTNSICQGQQVSLLWKNLTETRGLQINFAHQTFKWSNEARGVAAVYCVIVGFALKDRRIKKIYHYATVTSDPVESVVTRINPYLVDGPSVFLANRSEPLCKVPPMNFGNMPRDGGGFILSDDERLLFLEKEPPSAQWIRPYIGAEEFINRKSRWCLWLVDANPAELKRCPMVMERIERVRRFRLASKAAATRKFAAMPSLFCQITQPEGQECIVIPCHSSEKRKYIPIGYIDITTKATNAVLVIPGASLYHFAILTSTMHMAWTRYVCGRLELRYRYSKDIVYNNFPWPEPSDKLRAEIETAAQAVLDARAAFPDASLADLYDPLSMPPDLAKAHARLDRQVERAYGKSFESDAERVAFLFERYRELTKDLFDAPAPKRKGRTAPTEGRDH